jgi:anti-sigma regulatory factor (Ser/Thr protein kinase)
MLVLGRDLKSATAARQWFMDGFGALIGAAQADDAQLIISELVTNALRHGLGEVVLRVTLDAEGSLNVAVTDSGDGQPMMLRPDPTRIGGVGLRVVDTLGSAWGVAPFPGGKTVWAKVARGVTAPGPNAG